MKIKNYAYYAIDTGLIENIIVIDDEVAATIEWPEGYAVVELPENNQAAYGVGGSYINGQFIELPQPN